MHVLKDVAKCYELEDAISNSKPPCRSTIKEKKKELKEYMAKVPAEVEDYDTLNILHAWVQELLAFSGYDNEEVSELMKWLTDEMAAIAGRNSWAYDLKKEIWRFEERWPATMKFVSRLFEAFQSAAKGMGLPEKAFRLLYRRSAVQKGSDAYLELTRKALDVTGPERFCAVEKTHDRIVASIKRASSLVENLNSRLRPYMNIKKHVSSKFYSLIQFYLNTKRYRRSRVAARVGCSPVEILTGEQWLEFIELLEEGGFWDDCAIEEVA